MSADSNETARLRLPYLAAGQMQKHVTLNEALARLDMLVQPRAISRTVTDQPPSPLDGDLYILPAGATGPFWTLFEDGDLVRFDDGAWIGEAAPEGLLVHVSDEDRLLVRSQGEWRSLSTQFGELQSIDRLGVNAEADLDNQVAMRAPKILMTAPESVGGDGGDLRVVLNKQAPADIGSVVWQTAFQGRAEIGLTGTDDLSVKVSANGADWTTAIGVAAADGVVSVAGIGPLVRSETVAVLKRFTVHPGRRRAFLLDDLISTLMAAGVWDRLDMLYVLAAHDPQAARIDLKRQRPLRWLRWPALCSLLIGDMRATASPPIWTRAFR